MKKIFTKFFLLATLFLASTNLTAQTYYVLDAPTEQTLSYSLVGQKAIYEPAALTGPGAKLSFEISRNNRIAVGDTEVQQYVNGEWKNIASVMPSGRNEFHSYSYDIDAAASKIRFYNGYGSYKRTIRNVKVTMATYADAPAASSLTAPTATVGSPKETASTTMAWCNTPAFNLSISGKDSLQFTASIINNASAGNYGTATIKAIYQHNKVGTHNATLTIQTALGTHNIALTGETTKKAQTITWNIADADTKLPLNKIVENAATTISGLPITYTSSDETIIKIINNGTAFQAIKAGTATITATQAGDNNEWNAATPDSKEFTVTAKQIQSIVWEGGNLTRLKIGSEPITLSAKVQLTVNAETGEKKDSPERTDSLTYASANSNVVSVSGNVLTIVGEGETTLTVNVPGDEFYEAASVNIPVKVRQPSAGCEDILLVDQPAEISFFEMNTGEITKGAIAINTTAGVPDKLTFQHKGERWYLLGMGDGYYKGSIKAQQSTDGGNNWSDIAGSEVTPTVGQYNTLTVQLDRKATHIRFVRPSGAEGYHYVSGIVVTPAQYLETSLSSINETAIVGDIITKDIVINYANVKDEVLIAHNEDVNTVSISETGLGNDCGDFGKHTLKVTITPAEVGTITDNIVISDAVSKMNVTIPVTVDVRRNTQTILWNNADAEILTTADITFDAEAKTKITYTSSNTEVADVEDNKLVIKAEGEVIITATAEQDNKYEAATQTKKYIISKATPAIVSLPTVEAITYGATLEAVTLNGGETDTEGTWQWNADLTQVLNAGTHELAVQFIPTNTAWYNTLDSKVTVTVNKAGQTIAWDFTTTEMIVDETLTLNATALAGEVTFALTGDAATLEGNTLTAVKAGEVTITASQAGNDNYNAAEDVAHTITINKATPTVTAWPTLNDVVYGATYGEALQLIGGEASVEGAFSITNMPADLAQVPAVGEYTFGILFTPAKAESYNEVSDSVTLQVTKQLQTIAWDFADQELLIGNTLTLSATAPAGEVSFAIQPAEGVASLEGNTLTALAAGTVTITATAPENENYEAASVSYTVTVIKHTPEIITLPTVAPLGHGTALTDDMLNGGESNIEGTWSFINPSQALNMGNNEVAIRFTPTNTDLYNTIDATIIVEVTKATQEIIWDLTSPQTLPIGDFIVLNATATSMLPVDYDIEGKEGVIAIEDNILLTAKKVGTAVVHAVQEGNEYYSPAISVSCVITVYDPAAGGTGITNTTITGKDTEKVFINGQLFIIRNNQWYDTTGKLVK